jgi:hypothetical protein
MEKHRFFVKLVRFSLGLLVVVTLGLFVFFSKEPQNVLMCAEAGKLGEEAWRECVDYYINAGFTLNQINGKAPLPESSR